MPTALVLVTAVVLGVVGAWGMVRALSRLRLAPAERLALTLALFPALLGEAAFIGLLVGQPGAVLPAALCAVLGVLGWLVGRTAQPTRRPHPLAPSPSRGGAEGGVPHVPPVDKTAKTPKPPPLHRDGEGAGRWGLPGDAVPVLVGVALFAAGTLGTTLLTPLSAGALRIGDWVAHWFLVLVYLGQPLPNLRTFVNRVGDFGVISRPPLYNLEGGLLVGPLDVQFWPFQLLTPLLALSVAGAAVVWGRAIGGARAAWVVAGLVGLSPFLIQNASYPWSKMVAAGLVLLFLLMIRAAALARDPVRARQTFVLAAVCAGFGYLAHQTTIFYVLPTLAWLVWRRPGPLFRRPLGWLLGTWVSGGLAGLAAFAPWQLWVLATFGLRALLEANPASFGADVTDSLGGWLLKGGVAALGTLVPLPAIGALLRGSWPNLDQLLRIQLALLTGALGISGCWLLMSVPYRSARGGPYPPAPVHPTLGPLHPHGPVRGGGGARLPLSTAVGRGLGGGGLLTKPPWLALVVLCGFLGQVMLQPNWHDTGDAAESMTPIVVLGLAYVARTALSRGVTVRRLFFGLVVIELAVYLGLWLWWAFGAAWTRDPNAVLASRYGLEHVRGLWWPAVPLGALLLTLGLAGGALVLWWSLGLGRQPVARR